MSAPDTFVSLRSADKMFASHQNETLGVDPFVDPTTSTFSAVSEVRPLPRAIRNPNSNGFASTGSRSRNRGRAVNKTNSSNGGLSQPMPKTSTNSQPMKKFSCSMDEDEAQELQEKMTKVNSKLKEIMQNRALGRKLRYEEEIVEVKQKQRSKFKIWCGDVVQHPWFERTVALVILLNTIMLGMQSEVPNTKECAFFLSLSDDIILIFFTVELLMAVYGHGLQCIKCAVGVLNAFIVTTGWASLVYEVAVGSDRRASWQCGMVHPDTSSDDDIGVVQKGLEVARALRALRAARVLRCLTVSDTLWMTVQTFFLCLRPLLWTCFFIFILLYVYAISAVYLIGRRKDEIGLQTTGFETISESMMSFMQIMTLDEWFGIINPLLQKEMWTYLYFMTYIAIVALALMNLVTAMVIDSKVSFTDGAVEKEKINQQFDNSVKQTIDEVENIFTIFDEDENGMLSVEEFVKNALLATCLQTPLTRLGLTSEHALEEVFYLFTEQDAEDLTINEFLNVVQRLQDVSHDKEWVATIRCADCLDLKISRLGRVLSQNSSMDHYVSNLQTDISQSIGLSLAQVERQYLQVQSAVKGDINDLQSEVKALADQIQQSISSPKVQESAPGPPVLLPAVNESATQTDDESKISGAAQPAAVPARKEDITKIKNWQPKIASERSVRRTLRQIASSGQIRQLTICQSNSALPDPHATQKNKSGKTKNLKKINAAAKAHPLAPSNHDSSSFVSSPPEPTLEPSANAPVSTSPNCPDSTNVVSSNFDGSDILQVSPGHSTSASACDMGKPASNGCIPNMSERVPQAHEPQPQADEHEEHIDEFLRLCSEKLPEAQSPKPEVTLGSSNVSTATLFNPKARGSASDALESAQLDAFLNDGHEVQQSAGLDAFLKDDLQGSEGLASPSVLDFSDQERLDEFLHQEDNLGGGLDYWQQFEGRSARHSAGIDSDDLLLRLLYKEPAPEPV